MAAPEFVPLATLLAAPADVAPAPEPIPAPPAPERETCTTCATLRDALLFRATLADALDDAVARMLREIAAGVLARELCLAPCDLAAIVARVRAQTPVLRVRVARADAGCVLDVPTLVDDALQPGDAVVELDGGAIDARLGVRLACVLEACG